jgi:HK97 family phage prohead protease
MSKTETRPPFERRMFSTEFRAERTDGQPTKLVGYCAVFNTPADLGFFTEVIKPGAFTRTLSEGCDVRALFNHNADIVLGRTKDGGKTGTLSLSEDNTGLKFSVDMPDTQAARDLMTLVERGDVDQCSFGFCIREQNWTAITDADGDTTEVREILDVDLMDASVVTYPAYPTTSVEARSKYMFPEGAPVVPAHRAETALPAINDENEILRMRIRIMEASA